MLMDFGALGASLCGALVFFHCNCFSYMVELTSV